MRTRPTTPTGSQGSRALGIVSGFVLKLARQTAGDSQEVLAEALGVDVSTVQGWESGRRSLTALRASDLLRLRMHLVHRGAPASIGRHLSDALEADLVLAAGVDAGAAWKPRELHPLGASVHRRSLTNMVTWPLNGQPPRQLAALRVKSGRRGPAPAHPVLYPDEKERLFDHALTIAEQAKADPAHGLLRRQATYLLGFDGRADTAGWLRGEWRRAARAPADDLPGMLARRSAAVARASLGDAESLQDFVATLDRYRDATANLNYWAHWVGELPHEQRDDAFMTEVDPRSWGGLTLANHLVSRLDPQSPHLPLNIATLHALIASRPALLSDWPQVRTALAGALDRVAGCDTVPRRVRDQLAGLAYAVRLADR